MDWHRFLEEHNIPFVTRGPNTKRGEVSIHCPMCGDEDPSEHLGINVANDAWGCLRDASHRGKAARTLIKAILKCSSQQANSLVKQYSNSDPDTLDKALKYLQSDLLDGDVATKILQERLLDTYLEFNKIKARGVTKRFFNYLHNRGFDNPERLSEKYGLRCALTGRYKDRIIIPIYMNSELLGWTARAIGEVRQAPRYLMTSDEVKSTIFNYDNLKHGGKRLFIVEGPFDAIKLDNFKFNGNGVGYRATCTFGTSLTLSQLALLRSLIKRFESSWILFDRGAEGPARHLQDWLGQDAKVAEMPDGFKDPGEFDHDALLSLANEWYDGYQPLFRNPFKF
jgi:hypothetical protein